LCASDASNQKYTFPYNTGAVYDSVGTAIEGAQNIVFSNYSGPSLLTMENNTSTTFNYANVRGEEYGGYIYFSKNENGITNYGVVIDKGGEGGVTFGTSLLSQGEVPIVNFHSHGGWDSVVKGAINDGNLAKGAFVESVSYLGIGEGFNSKGVSVEAFAYNINYRDGNGILQYMNYGTGVSGEDMENKNKNPDMIYIIISPDTTRYIQY
jgi:hypothetical protein